MRSGNSSHIGYPTGAVLVAALMAGCAGVGTMVPAPSTALASPAVARTAVASDGGVIVEVSAAGGQTVVRLLDGASRAVTGMTTLAGRWALPTVLSGGPPEGVTPSGVVVLAAPPSSTSRFAMFKTPLRAPPRLIELPAGFTYDAVSPTGTKLYLIEHLPPGGSDRYQVRSYDVTAGRLDEAVVVDKTVVAELMSGRATSRVSSSLDGAIVATLYERADAPPFIHVLYTEAVRAQCIDLPKTAHGQQWALVGLNGDRLRLQEVRSGAQAAVDLVTGRMHGLVEATPGASHS